MSTESLQFKKYKKGEDEEREGRHRAKSELVVSCQTSRSPFEYLRKKSGEKLRSRSKVEKDRHSASVGGVTYPIMTQLPKYKLYSNPESDKKIPSIGTIYALLQKRKVKR